MSLRVIAPGVASSSREGTARPRALGTETRCCARPEPRPELRVWHLRSRTLPLNGCVEWPAESVVVCRLISAGHDFVESASSRAGSGHTGRRAFSREECPPECSALPRRGVGHAGLRTIGKPFASRPTNPSSRSSGPLVDTGGEGPQVGSAGGGCCRDPHCYRSADAGRVTRAQPKVLAERQ